MDDDINTAKEYFEKAAKQGHKESLCNIYDQEHAYPKAEDIYLRAFQKGDIDAGINLGILYCKNNILIKAEEILKPLAKRGIPKALLCLGETYRKIKNIEKAKFYLKLASEQGLSEALYGLGLIYWDEDKDKALRYYNAAAEKNNRSAQTMLGILHFESGDIKTARYYYNLAIQQNEPVALYNLASIEADEGNYTQAKTLYKRAAEQDFPGAKAKLKWIESVESFRMSSVVISPITERSYDEQDINGYIQIIKNEIKNSKKNSIFSEPAIPLCSSFDAKEIVKKLGAKWCSNEKTWFIPIHFTREPFDKFLPLIYKKNFIPFLPTMVPQNLWFKNLRAFLSKSSWNELRHACYKASNYRCIVCGQKGNLHCDEVWNYEMINQGKGIVHFERLSPLCARCHRVKHFGKAEADNLGLETFTRLLFINDFTIEEGKRVIEDAYKRWGYLSQVNWKFDFTKLGEDYNIFLEITYAIPGI